MPDDQANNDDNDCLCINKHDQLMKSYYGFDKDKMTLDVICRLKTFPYLDKDDIRLSMSDRNIIRNELDLATDSVLTDRDKPYIGDLF